MRLYVFGSLGRIFRLEAEPEHALTVSFASRLTREDRGTYITQLDAAKAFPGRITTGVTLLKGFYGTEDYQQDDALHRPDNLYILRACRRERFPNQESITYRHAIICKLLILRR